ncbi:MAG: RNA 3'-terminal phosphate cyclase [Candidatus Diapherotrites archaeon]|nr:RNA 3'-terminal phosphate cyclase [Candidatus Diapherotrites archaeon]
MNFLEVDASSGGQVLRTSLAYSIILNKPIIVKNIRSSRNNPGLKKQHLACLKLLKKMCNAKIKGAFLGSKRISFLPKSFNGGVYAINIGSAGSISLLLQSIMLPSLLKDVKISIEGGTDVPFSPSFIYLDKVFLPIIRKFGASYSFELIRRGYFPVGKGKIIFKSKSIRSMKPIKIEQRGALEKISFYSHCASFYKEVALNQISSAKKLICENINQDFLLEEFVDCAEMSETKGSGLDIIATFKNSIIGVNALNKDGKDAVAIGNEAANKFLEEFKSLSPFDKNMPDQLIPYVVLAKGNSKIVFKKVTDHLINSIKTAELFFDVNFSLSEFKQDDNDLFSLTVEGVGFEFN